jgi:hypothetical protein
MDQILWSAGIHRRSGTLPSATLLRVWHVEVAKSSLRRKEEFKMFV